MSSSSSVDQVANARSSGKALKVKTEPMLHQTLILPHRPLLIHQETPPPPPPGVCRRRTLLGHHRRRERLDGKETLVGVMGARVPAVDPRFPDQSAICAFLEMMNARVIIVGATKSVVVSRKAIVEVAGL